MEEGWTQELPPKLHPSGNNSPKKEKNAKTLPSERKVLKVSHAPFPPLCHMPVSVCQHLSSGRSPTCRLPSPREGKSSPGTACHSCSSANCVRLQNQPWDYFHLPFFQIFQMSSVNSTFGLVSLSLQLIWATCFNRGPEFREKEEKYQIRAFNETAKQRRTWISAAGILEPLNSSLSPFQNEETRSDLAINQKKYLESLYQTASALRAVRVQHSVPVFPFL